MTERYSAQLLDIATLIEQQQSLEAGLENIAARAARALRAGRCSVMLLQPQEEAAQPAMLRVYSHFGNLPAAAYEKPVPLEAGIAGRVVAAGEPLLVADIKGSELATLAHQGEAGGDSLMCAPIRIANRVVGVLNASQPQDGKPFTEGDLDLVVVFAMVIGQSVQVFELQHLCESRLLQMAQVLERRGAGGPIAPDPARVARVVAKAFYRELQVAGFGPKDIIAVATEVLSQLNENLDKHRARLARDP